MWPGEVEKMNRYRNELVSVIIPTYNRALKCKFAVESVLSQTHANVEVLVIDDGSQDNSREILSKLDRQVRYIYQKNQGVTAARNTGLKLANGEYIAFLDSDDTWLPWKLEAEISVLHSFPEAGMVWTDMTAVNEDGGIIQERYLKTMYAAYSYFDAEKDFQCKEILPTVWKNCPQQYFNKSCYSGNIFSYLFMGNLVHTSTVLVRRSRSEKVGLFDTSLIKSGEDYDYHLRTCRIGAVAYIDVPSIYYCIGSADQLTQNQYMYFIALNNLKTIKKVIPIVKKEISLPKKLVRKRIAQSYAWLGMTEFKTSHFRAAKHLFQSLLRYPFDRRVLTFLILSLFPQQLIEFVQDSVSSIKNIFFL